MNIVHAIVTCLIAFGTTFVLTLVIGFDDPVEEEGLKEDDLAQAETEVAVDYNDEIIKVGFEVVTPVLICNSNNFKDIGKLNVGKNTNFSEDILKVGGKANDL